MLCIIFYFSFLVRHDDTLDLRDAIQHVLCNNEFLYLNYSVKILSDGVTLDCDQID